MTTPYYAAMRLTAVCWLLHVACGGGAVAWKTGPAEPIESRSYYKRIAVAPDKPWTGTISARAGERVLVITEGFEPVPIEMTNVVVEKKVDGAQLGRVTSDGEVRIHVRAAHLARPLDVDITVMAEGELPIAPDGLGALTWNNDPAQLEGRRPFVTVARAKAGEIVVVSPLLDGSCTLSGGTPLDNLEGTGAAAARVDADGKIFAACTDQPASMGRVSGNASVAHGWILPGDLTDDQVVDMLATEAQGRGDRNERFVDARRAAREKTERRDQALEKWRATNLAEATKRGLRLYEEWKGELLLGSGKAFKVTVPPGGRLDVVVIATSPERIVIYGTDTGGEIAELDRKEYEGLTLSSGGLAGEKNGGEIAFQFRTKRNRTYGIVMLFVR